MSRYKTTEVFDESYAGKPVLAIREVDEIGTKYGVYPVISMGLKKAKAVIKHIDEIKKFVEENEK